MPSLIALAAVVALLLLLSLRSRPRSPVQAAVPVPAGVPANPPVVQAVPAGVPANPPVVQAVPAGVPANPPVVQAVPAGVPANPPVVQAPDRWWQRLSRIRLKPTKLLIGKDNRLSTSKSIAILWTAVVEHVPSRVELG
jgi:hypothetical protein